MPTMAMKMFKPTEFMNQMVGDGMRPKAGRTERSHPKTMPAIRAPPDCGQRQRNPFDLEDE